MASIFIEKFYQFFQGVLIFQSFFLAILFFITKKKDILYYAIFLCLSALYFFLNAPNTFFGLDDNVVFNSNLYRFANIPLIVITYLFYILFLKSFFAGLYTNKIIEGVYKIMLYAVPLLIIIFYLLRFLERNTQTIFYIVNLMAAVVSIFIIYGVAKNKVANTGWVATGMLFHILGTSLTILMIVLDRYNIHNLFTVDYPLVFMRLGILADLFFYQVALLKKWHYQEKQLAVQRLEKELAVEKIRNQISSQLHDDIGSTLSGVSMYSNMATMQFEKGEGEKGKISLRMIQKSANEIVGKLSDLVWSVNPGQDSLQQLLERLHQYGLDMCMTKNILFKMEINLPVKLLICLPKNAIMYI